MIDTLIKWYIANGWYERAKRLKEKQLKDNAALWESVGKGSIHLSALRLLKKTVEEEYVNEKS